MIFGRCDGPQPLEQNHFSTIQSLSHWINLYCIGAFVTFIACMYFLTFILIKASFTVIAGIYIQCFFTFTLFLCLFFLWIWQGERATPTRISEYSLVSFSLRNKKWSICIFFSFDNDFALLKAFSLLRNSLSVALSTGLTIISNISLS